MSVWRFSIEDDVVRTGEQRRAMLTRDGCNEPFKGRYWCPKLNWFRAEACPFNCKQECDNYIQMCGCL